MSERREETRVAKLKERKGEGEKKNPNEALEP